MERKKEDLKKILKSNKSEAFKLDRIDGFIRDLILHYPFCNYKGVLPPINSNKRFCDKTFVEMYASLYRIAPDLYSYKWENRFGECIAINRKLSISEIKSKNCIRYSKMTDNKNNEYYMGDYRLDKKYGKAVYDYWFHLISSNFNHELSYNEIKEKYNKIFNRQFYANLVVEQMKKG